MSTGSDCAVTVFLPDANIFLACKRRIFYIRVNLINMNIEPMTRTYDNATRAQKAAQTTENIIQATEQLLADTSLEEINLKTIAQKAGVTVQTVLRHMESRDGCFSAVADRVASRVETQRSSSEPGNVTEAIKDLMDHYEAEGKLVLNLLAQEGGSSFASSLTNEGRAYHRKWVVRCFSPLLSEESSEIIDGLVVATDIYTWKLLRLDMGRSRVTTERIINNMVNNTLETS
jgi:AcrR family transcriptional regulator